MLLLGMPSTRCLENCSCRPLSYCKKGFLDYLHNEDPDIILLNETKIAEDKAPSFNYPLNILTLCEVPVDAVEGYYSYFYSCVDNPGYIFLSSMTV